MIGTNKLFHYLMDVAYVPYVYMEDTSLKLRICRWLLNTFFMGRKLEYCEMLHLRQQIEWMRREYRRLDARYAKALHMYAAHAGMPEETWAYQAAVKEYDGPDMTQSENPYIDMTDEEFLVLPQGVAHG